MAAAANQRADLMHRSLLLSFSVLALDRRTCVSQHTNNCSLQTITQTINHHPTFFFSHLLFIFFFIFFLFIFFSLFFFFFILIPSSSSPHLHHDRL